MVTAIIQARMTSSRLPGKVMMNLCGQPVIAHILQRLKQCTQLDQIILATSDQPEDDALECEASANGICCFRGSLNDVLERFAGAADTYKAEHIVRICADSPLVDKNIVDNTIRFYKDINAAIVKTDCVPLGLGTEVFSYQSLKLAQLHAVQPYQREHVTPYIYENCLSRVYSYLQSSVPYRLTLDTPEDWAVIQAIYGYLYNGHHNFYCREILEFLKSKPEIATMNVHIEQVQVPMNINCAYDRNKGE